MRRLVETFGWVVLILAVLGAIDAGHFVLYYGKTEKSLCTTKP